MPSRCHLAVGEPIDVGEREDLSLILAQAVARLLDVLVGQQLDWSRCPVRRRTRTVVIDAAAVEHRAPPVVDEQVAHHQQQPAPQVGAEAKSRPRQQRALHGRLHRIVGGGAILGEKQRALVEGAAQGEERGREIAPVSDGTGAGGGVAAMAVSLLVTPPR